MGVPVIRTRIDVGREADVARADARTLRGVASDLDELALLVTGRLAEEGRQPSAPPAEVLDILATWEQRRRLVGFSEGASLRVGDEVGAKAWKAAGTVYDECCRELRAAYLLPLSS